MFSQIFDVEYDGHSNLFGGFALREAFDRRERSITVETGARRERALRNILQENEKATRVATRLVRALNRACVAPEKTL